MSGTTWVKTSEMSLSKLRSVQQGKGVVQNGRHSRVHRVDEKDYHLVEDQSANERERRSSPSELKPDCYVLPKQRYYSKEHPRFVTTFYEYLIASRNRNTGTLKHTEQLVISNHLEHLPTAGIRNFLRSYADSGRGNMDVIEPVLNLLEGREAFKDIRMNLTVMDNLLRCRRMPEEYMFKR